MKLNTEYKHRLPGIFLNIFLLMNGFAKRYEHDVIVLNTNHDISLSIDESLYGSHTHAGRQDSVVGCRTATALQVSENGHTCRIFRMDFLDHLSDSGCSTFHSMPLNEHDG